MLTDAKPTKLSKKEEKLTYLKGGKPSYLKISQLS